MAEEILKAILSCQIVIVFKHRKHKAFAESAGTQKKKEISGIFEQGNKICAIAIKITFGYNFVKIA
jgi:hypothetical protein